MPDAATLPPMPALLMPALMSVAAVCCLLLQGFAPHYDDIDAFVLQLEGCKRWRRAEPPFLPRTTRTRPPAPRCACHLVCAAASYC